MTGRGKPKSDAPIEFPHSLSRGSVPKVGEMAREFAYRARGGNVRTTGARARAGWAASGRGGLQSCGLSELTSNLESTMGEPTYRDKIRGADFLSEIWSRPV